MPQRLKQDEEPSPTPNLSLPAPQEIQQTGLEQRQQARSEEGEDICSLLQYALDKPFPLPWGVIACLSLPQLFSLSQIILMLQQMPVAQMAHAYLGNWILSLVLGLLAPAVTLGYAITTRRDQNIDAEIGALDVRWVGGLIESLKAPDRRVRSLAKRLLARLLPRLKASEASLLTAEMRQELYAILQRNSVRDTNLILGILRAVERIGDTAALPYVEPLTEQSRIVPLPQFGQRVALVIPNRSHVQRAAIACIEGLERRLETLNRTAAFDLITPVQSENESENDNTEQQTANARVVALVEQLREQRRTNGQPTLRWRFLIAAWLTIVPYTAWNLVQSALAHAWLYAGAWGIGFGLAIQLHRSLLSQSMTEAAKKLAAYDDIQGIGILAEALEWPDAEIQAIAEAALTRLLPRLNSSDAALLNADQRGCLHRMLTMHKAVFNSPLAFAILKALEQVGDASAVPYVERLANSLPITPMRRKIQQAAMDCLPYLTNRVAQQTASDTLLRASSPENSDPTLLLRAAGEVNTTDPRQLLRPGIGNESAL